MFDIGWSELIVIAVVALIAIGPKELPGVLRMVGQWVAKVRRMAADFQGQFNEAMREAEMADIKKQFDEIKDTAKSFTGVNLLTDATKEFDDALKLEDKPAAQSTSATEPVAPAAEAAAPAVEETKPATEAVPDAVSDTSDVSQAASRSDATPDAAPDGAAAPQSPAPQSAGEAAAPEPAAVTEPKEAKPEPAAPPIETGAVKAS